MGVNGIYGLSGSGLDIESMVKVGMMSKQNEYDKMYKKETKMEWKKEAYSNVYTDLNNFGMNKLTDYKLQSKMNAMSATSNNTSAFTVSANGSAAAMSHRVEVNELSSNAYLMSTQAITRATGSSDSMLLSDIIGVSGTAGDNTSVINFVVDDGVSTLEEEKRTINITSDDLAKGMTLNDLASKIKKLGLNITASYDSVNDSFSLYNSKGGSDNKISLDMKTDKAADLFNRLNLGQSKDGELVALGSGAVMSGTVSLANEGASGDALKDVLLKGMTDGTVADTYDITKADGTTATVGKNDAAFSFDVSDGTSTETFTLTYGNLASGRTLDDLVSSINAHSSSGFGVKASYEDGKFSLTNEAIASTISVKANDDGAAALLQKLGLGEDLASGSEISESGQKPFQTNSNTEVTGSNGKITVDGREYTNITDNRITVAGVTYTLLDKTSAPATVTVTQDQSSIIDRVKQFVEDYNTMLDGLQEKYNEQKYSDYDVLTKSQEEAMTKEQIDKWNEKAKSGLLNRDKFIGDIISKMREALATPVDGVDGKYNSAFSIGIRTTTDQGHIEFDEEKLKKVLNEEPNSVYQIFGKLGDYDEKTGKYDFKGSGVAQRLGDVVNDGIKKIKAEAGTSTAASDGSALGSKILEWQNKMSDFKVKMNTFETLLYKKYDAMEVALQKLSMTLNYVTGGNG